MSDRRALWLAYAGLLAVSLFFLIRPLLLDPGNAYRPRLVPGVTYAYSFVVVAAFIPYSIAAWASRRGVSVRAAAMAGGVLHLIVLFAPLTQSQDLYAYLFYGKVWSVHGANPYTTLPLSFPSDPWFPWMQWRDVGSVYGPFWTMVTGGVARLAGSSLAAGYVLIKLIVLGLGVAGTLGIVRASQLRGRAGGREVLLGLWNPLVIVALSLGGHADVAVVAAVVWALIADRRGRPLLATLALTAAWLVKPYAGVVLLVYLLALARRRLRGAMAAVGVAGGVTVLAWLPFWRGSETLSALATVGAKASASLAGQAQLLLGAMLEEDLARVLVRVAGVMILLGVIAVGSRRSGFPEDPWPLCAAAFVAYALVTPWLLYWHLTGPLALALVAGSSALRAGTLTFSGTAMLTASLGGSAWGRALQTVLRYAPPLAAGLRAGKQTGTGGIPPRSHRPQRSSA